MAQPLADWIASDVEPYRDADLSWLSEEFFFRDPVRATLVDTSVFMSPADGVVLYCEQIDAASDLMQFKGQHYTLRDAMQIPVSGPHVVCGIFMTFYDVHVNRVPYSGLLSYRALEPLTTSNCPMLEVERELLQELRLPDRPLEYMYKNQRMVNTFVSNSLPRPFYLVQIADYDVDCICPFELGQNNPVMQGDRFSLIRFGSQVDLVIPVDPDGPSFEMLVSPGFHVKAGVDPLVRIHRD